MPNRRELVEAIAEALHPVSANQLPAVCTRLGLREGTVDEAMSSKRTYVRTRLEGLPDADVVAFGARVMVERPTLTLKKTLDLLTSDAQHSITALTRDALLDELFLMGGSATHRATSGSTWSTTMTGNGRTFTVITSA
ncbi:hypothetical protein [Hyalangium gracile]|uniref:hypothetical protein n=1 Tax=Hyalangium gracile TaxID=394092 RepID=UPI001CCAFAC9|nr:hypothetical protein [Hyalangium gracile]